MPELLWGCAGYSVSERKRNRERGTHRKNRWVPYCFLRIGCYDGNIKKGDICDMETTLKQIQSKRHYGDRAQMDCSGHDGDGSHSLFLWLLPAKFLNGSAWWGDWAHHCFCFALWRGLLTRIIGNVILQRFTLFRSLCPLCSFSWLIAECLCDRTAFIPPMAS